MYFVAIAALERGNSAKPEKVAPGYVIELPEKSDEVKRFLDYGAIREATEDEVKIANALDRFHGAEESDAPVKSADKKATQAAALV